MLDPQMTLCSVHPGVTQLVNTLLRVYGHWDNLNAKGATQMDD